MPLKVESVVLAVALRQALLLMLMLLTMLLLLLMLLLVARRGLLSPQVRPYSRLSR